MSLLLYKTKKINAFGLPTKSNEITFWIEFDTMQIEKHDEVWILETYNFIGTVGGSLSLFNWIFLHWIFGTNFRLPIFQK